MTLERHTFIQPPPSRRTSLIDVVFALRQFGPWDGHNAMLLSNCSVAFAENYELVTWKIVLLDCLADDLFGHSVAIDIGRIPLRTVQLLDRFGEKLAESLLTVLSPLSYAAFRSGRA